MSHTRKTLLIVCLSLPVFLATLWLIWFAVERHRLNVALADLRAQGEPLTFAELAPPPVPDDQNAVILYNQAHARYLALPDESQATLKHLIRKKSPLTPDEVKQARLLLDSCSDVFDLIRQADQKPSSRLNIDYGAAEPAKIPLPELSRISQLSNLLYLAAKLDLAEGRPDQAAEKASQIARMSRPLFQPPITICLLVGFATEGKALNTLQALLEQTDPPESTLRSILQPLPDLDDRSSLIRSLQGERAMMLICLQNASNPRKQSSNPNAPPIVSPGIRVPLFKPFLDHQMFLYLQGMQEIVSVARQPYFHTGTPWDKFDVDFDRRHSHQVFNFLLSGVEKVPVAYDTELARRGLARLAIALRLYRMKNGTYPDSLSPLTPDFLDKLPTDPFSGHDFIYRKVGPGFLLYSLGENLADDGGKDDPQHPDHNDIVWKCSH